MMPMQEMRQHCSSFLPTEKKIEKKGELWKYWSWAKEREGSVTGHNPVTGAVVV